MQGRFFHLIVFSNGQVSCRLTSLAQVVRYIGNQHAHYKSLNTHFYPFRVARLRWHFIGHLQQNKVRKVLPLVEAIHSVDSSEIARRIDFIAAELGLFPKVYLQVNTAGEAGKFGFPVDAIRAEFDSLLELERIEIIGLMLIPPLATDPLLTRREFIALRELRDELADHSGLPLQGLSMGMSNDYEMAIEEGATAVRVGSSIFGDRKARKAKD